MRILLINHYAGSPEHGMEFRPYYLAREWVRHGHHVRIVASSFSHLRSRNPSFDGPSQLRTADGIEYHWLRTRPYRGNGAARLRNMVEFTAKLWRTSTALVNERPDVVIASSTYPYDIWPAARIARRAGARLVHEIHDLWPLTPKLLGGFGARHPMIASMQWAEDYACRNADRIVSILPGTKEYLETRGMAAEKFVHVPNGFDPEAARQAAPADVVDRIRAFAQRYKACCIYAGGHSVSNALDTLIEVAARPEVADIGFILVGDGTEKERLVAQARRDQISNILFLDPVSKAAVPSVLVLADFAYIGWRNSPLYDHGMSPNKLFDYMSAMLPVLHATSAPYDIVAQAQCGLSVPADDVAAIARAAALLGDTSPQERNRLGGNGCRYARTHHAYPVLAHQFLQAMQP